MPDACEICQKDASSSLKPIKIAFEGSLLEEGAGIGVLGCLPMSGYHGMMRVASSIIFIASRNAFQSIAKISMSNYGCVFFVNVA